MKLSVSISFIWQLASHEAIAAEFKEILPEHFFLAMLKISEIPIAELEKVGAGKQDVQMLVSDAEAIRSELVKRQINPATLRRALRPVLGHGGNPYEGGELHRAPASREYFDKAAILAADARCDTLTGQHLFSALLASPTAAMTDLLGEAALIDPRKIAAEMPLLAKHGKDLCRLAAEAADSSGTARIAEARAIILGLLDRQRSGVLLATDRSEAAYGAIESVAGILIRKDAPPELKGKRLIDVSAIAVAGSKGQAGRDLLVDMFAEAARVKNIILFVPALVGARHSTACSDWEETLGSAGLAAKVPFIARLAPPIQERIAKNPGWRKAARIIAIQDRIAADVPDAL